MNRSGDRFADVLRESMRRPSYRVTPGLLAKLSGVPKATIVNWLEGRVARPRRWQDLIRVADALRLDAADTDRLLRAGDQATLAELSTQASGRDALLLSLWRQPARPLGSTRALTPGLIHPTNPIIGRQAELVTVTELVRRPDVRFVTLTGPAGVGKTRLALHVAEALHADFADGVAVVPLAPVTDWQRVLPTIAGALGLPKCGLEVARSKLHPALADRSLLLVLDNVEHVTEAIPSLSAVLDGAPRVKVLATSRAVLRIYGEHQVEVLPLPLPDLTALPDPRQTADNDAVALFVARARAVDPSFALTARNAAAAAQLVVGLDGLPLSIELAAARSKLLTPQGLLARLGNRLGLLTWGARDHPERHQSLRATLDWSFHHLDPPAMALFTRLSVFPAGCTVDSAEAVADGDGPDDDMVIDVLMRLVDNSLMRKMAGRGGDWRFSMLETIREYALDQARRRGQLDADYARFLAHTLTLAEAAAGGIVGSDQLAWLARLDDECDNTRAAITWALGHDHEATVARIATALHRYWVSRGHLDEGRRCLRMVLAGPPLPSAVEALARTAAGELARRNGDLDTAEAEFDRSLTLGGGDADAPVKEAALGGLGLVAADRAHFAEAEKLLTAALELHRLARDALRVAETLSHLGDVARRRGDAASAVELQVEALNGIRTSGERWTTALVLTRLGRALADHGQLDEALSRLGEALSIWVELDERVDVAACVEALAVVTAHTGDWERTARLAGAAARLRAASGAYPAPADHHLLAQQRELTRANLGDERFARAERAGDRVVLADLVRELESMVDQRQ